MVYTKLFQRYEGKGLNMLNVGVRHHYISIFSSFDHFQKLFVSLDILCCAQEIKYEVSRSDYTQETIQRPNAGLMSHLNL